MAVCFKYNGNILSAIDMAEQISIEHELQKGNDKDINNRMFESYISVLTNPKNYQSIMTPLDDNWLKDEVYNIDPKAKDAGLVSGMDFMNPSYQIESKIKYRAGKMGVAQTAQQIVDAAMSVNTDVEIPLNIINREKESLNKFSRKDEYVMWDTKTGEVLTGKAFDEANSIANKNRKPVAVMLSTLMNAYVDIAKDPYISLANITTDTFPVASLLFRSGLQKEMVLAFMMNPVIREWAQATSQTDSVYFFEQDNKQVFLDKYGIEASDIKVTEDDTPERVFLWNAYDLGQMRDFINNPSYLQQESIDKDLIIKFIKTFEIIKKTAGTIGQDLKVNDSTTKGAGRSAAEMFLRTNNYNDDKSLINYDTKLQSNSGTNSPLKTISDISYGEINKALNNFSDSFNKELGEASMVILDNLNITEANINKFESINRLLYTKLMQRNLTTFTDTNYIRLFSKEDGSISDQVTAAQKNLPNNFFIQNLYVDATDMNYNHIKLSITGSLDVPTKTKLREGFQELMSYDHALALDLAKYAFYATGFNSKRNSFAEFIPPEFTMQAIGNNEFNSLTNDIGNVSLDITQNIDIQLNDPFRLVKTVRYDKYDEASRSMKWNQVKSARHAMKIATDNFTGMDRDYALFNAIESGHVIITNSYTKQPAIKVYSPSRKKANLDPYRYYKLIREDIRYANKKGGIAYPHNMYIEVEKKGYSGSGFNIYELDGDRTQIESNFINKAFLYQGNRKLSGNDVLRFNSNMEKNELTETDTLRLMNMLESIYTDLIPIPQNDEIIGETCNS